jgi:hypothetical protein
MVYKVHETNKPIKLKIQDQKHEIRLFIKMKSDKVLAAQLAIENSNVNMEKGNDVEVSNEVEITNANHESIDEDEQPIKFATSVVSDDANSSGNNNISDFSFKENSASVGSLVTLENDSQTSEAREAVHEKRADEEISAEVDTLDKNWQASGFSTTLAVRDDYVTYLTNWAEVNKHTVSYLSQEEEMPANNPEFKQNCKHVQILHVWKASLHDSENNLVGELTVKRSVRKVAKQLCAYGILMNFFSFYPSDHQIAETPDKKFGNKQLEKKYRKVFYFIGSQEFTINCKYSLIWCGVAFKDILKEMGLLVEFDRLFDIWYQSKLTTTTKWLRFDVRTKKFSLKDRDTFVIDDPGMSGTLIYDCSKPKEKKIQSYLNKHYIKFDSSVKAKIKKNDSNFKCFKYGEVLWSISRIIGRQISTCGKWVAYKVVWSTKNGHVYVQPYVYFSKLIFVKY